MDNIAAEKSRLRKIFTRRNADTPPETADLSLLEPILRRARSVFCYVSCPGEVSTVPILRFCLDGGVTLAAPRCCPGRVMRAHVITSLDQLTAGVFGIPEPPETAPVLMHPEIIIVPGLAFDGAGYRLGRGGGYYDRYLASRDGLAIGLCPAGAYVEALPRGAHDRPVDLLLGTMGFIWTK